MYWDSVLWLVAMVLLLMMEASTVSLVSLWFAVGALAALVVSFITGTLWVQILVFLVVSGGMLALLRPVAKKYFTPKLVKTNVDAVVNSTGLVTEAIDNRLSAGRVKLAGMEWSARSTSGEPIEKDILIRVDRVEGVKVFVTAVEVPVTSNSQEV